MSITTKLEPTAKLRWIMRTSVAKDGAPKDHAWHYTDKVLQQWWSNEMNVRMGPAQMIKGEWRDVEVANDSAD